MRLGSFSSPGPRGKPGGLRRGVPHARAAALAALLALCANMAFAQVDINGTMAQYQGATGASDMSTMAFTSLLGTFFSNPFAALGSAGTLLGSMFLIFNTFVLVVGTIWATYGVGVAVVQTAHEGQLMGKRLSQIWMPIRMVTGVASLIPAFGGFSLSQAVLVFATTIGIGAANYGYQQMINGVNNMTTLVSPSLVHPAAGGSASLNEAGFAIFRSEICMRALNDYANQQQQVTGLDQTPIRVTITRPPGGVTGVQFGTPDSPAYCGAVNVTATSIDSREASSVGGFRVASVNYDNIAKAMATRAQNGFDPYQQQVQQLADTWYDSYVQGTTRPVVPVAQIEGIAANYYSSLQPNSTEASSSAGAVSASAIQAMQKYGWFGAGAWSATLAEVNAAVAQAAQTVNFRTVLPQVTTQQGGYNTALADVMRSFDTAAQTASTAQANSSSTAASSSSQALCRFLANTVTPYSTSSSASSLGTAPTGNCSFGQSFVMELIDASTAGAGGATSTAANDLRIVDPIVAMKNMGDYLMIAAESLYTVYSYLQEGTVGGTVMNIAGKVSGFIPGMSVASAVLAPLKGIAAILPLLMGGMFLLGMIMSIWIPMIPFVTWWGGLVQYLTIFFEGVVAAPIWAFVHLDAQGEGMGNRTETGYLFIINMLFRPFLMLLGFVASLALMIVMGSFLFWLYPSVMGNIQGNSITGVFSILGFLFIFWILMHTLVQTLSNLSVMLPDQALNWAGKAIGASLGRDTEGQTRGHFMAFGRFGQQGMLAGAKPDIPKPGARPAGSAGGKPSPAGGGAGE